MLTQPTAKHGFTLIELSIVLVIIGLLVGGVLVGKDLIRSAQERALVKQIEQYQTAVFAFRDKYGALPGDMANATSFWPADPECGAHELPANPGTATCNGNGDGTIGGYAADWNEIGSVWNHLALAGMIPGLYQVSNIPGSGAASPVPSAGTLANIPLAQWGTGAVGIELYMNSGSDIGSTAAGSTIARNVFIVGYCSRGSGVGFTWPCDEPFDGTGYAFTANQASEIDRKIDDGLPYTGNVLASYDYFRNNCGNGPTNAYVNSDLAPSFSPQTGCTMLFLGKF